MPAPRPSAPKLVRDCRWWQPPTSIAVCLRSTVTSSCPSPDAFTLGLAARYEDYDDFGDATIGKVSARWALTDQFAVRGTVGTNFRAPSLAQTGFQFFTQNFGAGGQLETFGHLPVSNPVAIANGALPLTEEESTNYTVGFVFNGGNAFSLTADYYFIEIEDRLSIVGGTIDNVTYFANLVDTETDGFDIQAQGALEIGNGAVRWLLAYNTAETEVQNPEVLGEEELNQLESMAPEDKFIASGTWSLDWWYVTARAQRVLVRRRAISISVAASPIRKPTVPYGRSTPRVGFDITENWLVAVGGDNIFDEYPDESDGNINFFGHLPYDVLSPIGMNGRYWYLRTSYDF